MRKLQAVVRVFDLRVVRQVAIENPEGVRQLALELQTVLADLG
ncbi:hypothetical protein [Planomonospora sp. ID67723]|nr:hypothetical protein [Planomonospora sp. ID67723]